MFNLVFITAEPVPPDICVVTQDLKPPEPVGISQFILCTCKLCASLHCPTLKFICHFSITPLFQTSFCTSSHFASVFTNPNSFMSCQNFSFPFLFPFQVPDTYLKDPRSQHETLQYSAGDFPPSGKFIIYFHSLSHFLTSFFFF